MDSTVADPKCSVEEKGVLSDSEGASVVPQATHLRITFD